MREVLGEQTAGARTEKADHARKVRVREWGRPPVGELVELQLDQLGDRPPLTMPIPPVSALEEQTMREVRSRVLWRVQRLASRLYEQPIPG
jgi:hypothetical protein